jgi:hypothetical protein
MIESVMPVTVMSDVFSVIVLVRPRAQPASDHSALQAPARPPPLRPFGNTFRLFRVAPNACKECLAPACLVVCCSFRRLPLMTASGLVGRNLRAPYLPALAGTASGLSAPGGRMLCGASASASPPSGFTAPPEVPP